jgi:hypothetical protein
MEPAGPEDPAGRSGDLPASFDPRDEPEFRMEETEGLSRGEEEDRVS